MPLAQAVNPLIDYIKQTLNSGAQPPVAGLANQVTGGGPSGNADGPPVPNDFMHPNGQREGDRRRIAVQNLLQQKMGRNLNDDELSNLMTEIDSPKNWSDQELVELGTPQQQ